MCKTRQWEGLYKPVVIVLHTASVCTARESHSEEQVELEYEFRFLAKSP